MRAELADLPGATIELGSGIGSFKEFHPAVTATDVSPTPWAAEVVDAQDLPYRDSTVANVVMIDVLHHLPRPTRFFDEAERVLVPGGRVLMAEPYWSAVSGLAYRLGHHEDADPRADPFSPRSQSGSHPLEANIALPTLIFWRYAQHFRQRHPGLDIVARDRFAWLVYPLSGGFSRRRVLPLPLVRPMSRLESALRPVNRLAAFRCLVVLERRPGSSLASDE